MQTNEEIYNSLIKVAQELNNILDDLQIPLTKTQVENLINEIGKAQKKVDNFSKNNHHK